MHGALGKLVGAYAEATGKLGAATFVVVLFELFPPVDDAVVDCDWFPPVAVAEDVPPCPPVATLVFKFTEFAALVVV